MSKATIYVLPSIDEPYPMSVLEAMPLGVPVLVTDTCGLAPLVMATDSGIVVGSDEVTLTDAIRTLLAHPEHAAAMGQRGKAIARARFDMNTVAEILERRTSARDCGGEPDPARVRQRRTGRGDSRVCARMA